ncbi:hypothetical protein K0M31_000417 [Melipona bicolor]|uniref:Uncharacterized protein n=1 Tax=Melipona bicolor TaxID=60889 RepID=A0AA40KWT7_9HYME|nr:hypothetical protein K0M31_000417 [Melipona bicolor]
MSLTTTSTSTMRRTRVELELKGLGPRSGGFQKPPANSHLAEFEAQCQQRGITPRNRNDSGLISASLLFHASDCHPRFLTITPGWYDISYSPENTTSSLMPDISCLGSFFSKSVGSDLPLPAGFQQIVSSRSIDSAQKRNYTQMRCMESKARHLPAK